MTSQFDDEDLAKRHCERSRSSNVCSFRWDTCLPTTRCINNNTNTNTNTNTLISKSKAVRRIKECREEKGKRQECAQRTRQRTTKKDND